MRFVVGLNSEIVSVPKGGWFAVVGSFIVVRPARKEENLRTRSPNSIVKMEVRWCNEATTQRQLRRCHVFGGCRSDLTTVHHHISNDNKIPPFHIQRFPGTVTCPLTLRVLSLSCISLFFYLGAIAELILPGREVGQKVLIVYFCSSFSGFQ